MYIIKERNLKTMTVNITLNEISVKNAMDVLELISRAQNNNNVTALAADTEEKATKKAEPKEQTQETKHETKTTEPAEPLHTIEDVRAAFSAYAKAKGKDKAKELLAKLGADKVTTLDPSKYGDAMQEIKEG